MLSKCHCLQRDMCVTGPFAGDSRLNRHQFYTAEGGSVHAIVARRLVTCLCRFSGNAHSGRTGSCAPVGATPRGCPGSPFPATNSLPRDGQAQGPAPTPPTCQNIVTDTQIHANPYLKSSNEHRSGALPAREDGPATSTRVCSRKGRRWRRAMACSMSISRVEAPNAIRTT